MDIHLQLALFHVLIIAPFLIYVGLAREQVPDSIFYLLGALGIYLLAYHIYKAYTKLMADQNPWINYIHIFLVAPLLLILAVNGKTTNRKYFELLLMVGFSALGYHALSIIREIIAR